MVFKILLVEKIHDSRISVIIPQINNKKNILQGFPGGAVVENPPANAGDTGSSPGLGRSHMPRSS